MRHNRPDRGFYLECRSSSETPARHFDITKWPRYGCVGLPTSHCEWFDSNLLLIEGAEKLLADVANAFSSERILIAGLMADFSTKLLDTIRVIDISIDKVRDVYFKAIWDKESWFPSGELSAAARITMIWDPSEGWAIFNDRFFEIGLFVVFGRYLGKAKGNILRSLSEEVLIERFAGILKTNKVSALSELRRWQDACGA
jgi:hypothetical protein